MRAQKLDVVGEAVEVELVGVVLSAAEAGEQIGVVADEEVGLEANVELLYMSTVSRPKPPPPAAGTNGGEVGPQDHRQAVANAKAASLTV